MTLPIFFENYGVSVSANGILISIGTFAGIISVLIAGKFSNNFGRKPFLIFGASLFSMVFFLFAFLSKDFKILLLLRFIEGFSFYMTPIAITAMAADIFPAEERGKAMPLYSVANCVGQLAGLIIA